MSFPRQNECDIAGEGLFYPTSSHGRKCRRTAADNPATAGWGKRRDARGNLSMYENTPPPEKKADDRMDPMNQKSTLSPTHHTTLDGLLNNFATRFAKNLKW